MKIKIWLDIELYTGLRVGPRSLQVDEFLQKRITDNLFEFTRNPVSFRYGWSGAYIYSLGNKFGDNEQKYVYV
jgi:hypothetical protein